MQLHAITKIWHKPSMLLSAGGTFVVAVAIVISSVLPSAVGAEQLDIRTLQISDSTTGMTNVNYTFSFTTITAGAIGSITFEACSNYMYEPTDPCTPPPGFDASAALLTAQAGTTDFAMDPATTASKIIISRPVATGGMPGPLAYEFAQVNNPTTVGSYYVRIATYASSNASGPELDYGIVVFATNLGIEITTEVPPYLLFCTGITIDGFNCGTAEGSFISFGELSSSATRSATSQMLASTNAPYGYSITLAGTTMTAGNNVIPAMTGGPSQPGTSQFGINGRANGIPGVGTDPIGPGLTNPNPAYNAPNSFRFKSGDIIASSGGTDDYRKMTVSYIVNAAAGQPPGRYVSTISYICLASF